MSILVAALQQFSTLGTISSATHGRELGTMLAPQDVRSTFAKLAHTGRAPVEQIQLSLGHASIETTERYLGVAQNLTDAPCDHLGIRGPGK